MRTATTIGPFDELDGAEEEVLCALYATLDEIGATLRRVRVRVTSKSGRHVCRLRARLVRGDLLIIEARAATSREAIRAASQVLEEALSKRVDPSPAESGIRRARVGPKKRGADHAALAGVWNASPPSKTSRPPWRLLVALQESECPAAALEWAAALADQLRLELHILRVLTDGAEPSSRRSDWVDITRDVQRRLAATRETREWCDEVLSENVRAEQICVRVGELSEEVAVRASEIEPDMIVLSASADHTGQTATVLAQAAARPVLVAREQRARCTLLAATDLKDDGYPVLRKAAELGRYLHASVVAFHHVNGSHRTPSGVNPDVSTAKQKERLEMAADRLLNDGEVCVAEGDDPALAIVANAKELAADTIVVGTRSSGFGCSSTAAKVIARSDRSVLVVPLDEPTAAWDSWQVR